MCFFFSSDRGVHAVESNVGPCQFCSSPASVDLVEYRTKTWWFCFIPTEEHVERMVVCRICGWSIKEVYYTMREKQMEESIPIVEAKVASDGVMME